MAISGTSGVDSMLQSLGLSREFASNVGKALGARKTGTANLEALMYSMHVAMDGAQNLQNQGTGNKMASQGFVPRPIDFANQLFDASMPPIGRGFGGVSAARPFGDVAVGRSLQTAMLTSPGFTGALEKTFGGTIVPNGSPDGKVVVFKNAQIRSGDSLRQAMKTGALPRSPIPVAIASVNAPLQGPGLSQGPQGGVLKKLAAFEQNIKSFASGISGSADTMNPQVLAAAKAAGINVQNPSFEESITLALMTYGVNQEKDISGKIKELDKSLAASQNGTAPATATGTNDVAAATGIDGRQAGAVQAAIRPGGGVMGGLVSPAGGTTAKDIVGEVDGVGVPGRPELANGGPVTQAGTGVQDPSQLSDTMKQQMLQKMMTDLQKMYEMLSNIMKTMHDMMMKPIQNLRG